MNNKGQAAMEFLMTYGWAILVVLAAIFALAYFGVLSPDRFKQNQTSNETYNLTTEMVCNQTCSLWANMSYHNNKSISNVYDYQMMHSLCQCVMQGENHNWVFSAELALPVRLARDCRNNITGACAQLGNLTG